MPYQPPPGRRFAPTSLPGTMPGMQPPRPAAAKPSMPAQASPDGVRKPQQSRNPFLTRVSPHKFNVKADKVFEHLFGEPLEENRVSGVAKNFQPGRSRAADNALVSSATMTPPVPFHRPQDLQMASMGPRGSQGGQNLFNEPSAAEALGRLFQRSG